MDNLLPKDAYVRIMEHVMGLYLSADAPADFDEQTYLLEELRDGEFPQPYDPVEKGEKYWPWEPFEDYPAEWIAEQIDNTYKSLISLIHGIARTHIQGGDNACV